MNNSLAVLPTKTFHRKYAKGDYIIALDKNKKKELKIGKFAVVGYVVQYSGPPDLRRALERNKIESQQELCVHARVIAIDESFPKEVQINEDQVCIDQTIRNAIGIPYFCTPDEFKVNIYRIKMPFYSNFMHFFRYYLSGKFGFRYLYFRVCSAHIHDMEKGIVRIPRDTFPILGTHIHNKLVLENPVKIKKEGKPAFCIKVALNYGTRID